MGTLYSYGICVSYDKLRVFLTSVAENELHHMRNGVYSPSSINITTVDCSLVQEGDDNVEINCETIDGKNIFQLTCNGAGIVSRACRQ